MLRPNKLKIGDTIGIVSPASIPKKENIAEAIQVLKALGFKVKLGRNYDKKNGYLAGTDLQRAADLQEMFLDPTVKAIICSRGGYGSARLTEWIDFEVIKKHPKIFIGYSDITYLHLLFNEKIDLITFHGLMAQPELSKEIDPSTLESLNVLLLEEDWKLPTAGLKTLVSGRAEGISIGGNLTVLLSSFGTSSEPNLNGKIVLLEDIGEDPYRIDRMLNQLYLSKKWEQASGFLLGSFTDCTPSDRHKVEVDTVLNEYFKKMNKPTIYNLPVGHSIPNYIFPLNTRVTMNTWTKEIVFKKFLE